MTFQRGSAIGLVTSSVAPYVYYLGNKRFIAASIGHQYVIYDGDTLRIEFVSATFEEPIRALCASQPDGNVVVAFGRSLALISRSNTRLWHSQVAGSAAASPLLDVRFFGELVLAVSRTAVHVFDTTTGDLLGQFARGKFDLDVIDDGSKEQGKRESKPKRKVKQKRKGDVIQGDEAREDETGGDESSVRWPAPEFEVGGFYGASALLHHIGRINEWLVGGSACRLALMDPVDTRCLKRFDGIRGWLSAKLAVAARTLAYQASGLARPSSMACDDFEIDCITAVPLESRVAILAISPRGTSRDDISPKKPSPTESSVVVFDQEADKVLLAFDLKHASRVTVLAAQELGLAEGKTLLLYAGFESGKIAVIDVMAAGGGTGNIDVSQEGEGGGSGSGSVACAVRMFDAHTDRVTLLRVEADGLVISAGADNSIRMFQAVYRDGLDSLEFRPVKERVGFGGIINQMAFYELGREGQSASTVEGKDILVSSYTTSQPLINGSSTSGLGSGRTRCEVGKVSFVQAQQHRLFTQKKSLRSLSSNTHIWRNAIHSLPMCVSMTYNVNRHYDWPNCVTCHHNLHQAMLWSVKDGSLVPAVLQRPDGRGQTASSLQNLLITGGLSRSMAQLARLEEEPVARLSRKAAATAACISPCGHFVVVGYRDGQLHKFSLQSRRHLGAFKRPHDADSNLLHNLASTSYVKGAGAEAEVRIRGSDGSKMERMKDMGLKSIFEPNANRLARKRRAFREEIMRETIDRKAALEKGDIAHDAVVLNAHKCSIDFIHITPFGKVITASTERPEENPGRRNGDREAAERLVVREWDLTTKQLLVSFNVSPLLNRRNTPVRFSQLLISSVHLVCTVEWDTGDGKKSQVILVDLMRRMVVRRYSEIAGEVTCLRVSPNNAWISVATTDSHLYTYDVKSALLISWLSFPSPIRTFTFHPSFSHLITSHALKDNATRKDDLVPQGALYSWINLEAFENVTTRVKEYRKVTAPTPVDALQSSVAADDDALDSGACSPLQPENPTALDIQVPSMSKWSSAQLKLLLAWDKIKAKEGATDYDSLFADAQSDLPFFLYAEQSLSAAPNTPASVLSTAASEGPDAASLGALEIARSPLEKLIESGKGTGKGTEKGIEKGIGKGIQREMAMKILEELEGSKIPVIHEWVESLMPLQSEGEMVRRSLQLAVQLFLHWVHQKSRMDLVQALLSLFLKMHTLTLCELLQDGEETMATTKTGKAEKEGGEEKAEDRESWAAVKGALRELAQGTDTRWAPLHSEVDSLICSLKHLTLVQFAV